MRTVEEVRRLRLGLLRDRYKTLSDLNEKLGLVRRDSTLSQILNKAKNSKTGKPKEMGSELARRIELTLGLDVGWMDTDPAFDAVAVRLSIEAMQLAEDFDRRPAHEREAMLTLWRTLNEVVHQAGSAPPATAGDQDVNTPSGDPTPLRRRH